MPFGDSLQIYCFEHGRKVEVLRSKSAWDLRSDKSTIAIVLEGQLCVGRVTELGK